MDYGRDLATLLGMADVQMIAAESLPPPQVPLKSFSGSDGTAGAVNTNAFARSYAYNPDTKELAMHIDRLGSSGDFGLVCIHALSHIKVAPFDITNDHDPKFMAEFYKNLKVLSQDLYRQQSRAKKDFGVDSSTTKEEKQVSQLSSMKRMGSKLLEVARQSSHGSIGGGTAADTGKDRLSQSEQKLKSERDYFSSDNMADRLMQYANSTGVTIPGDYYDRYKKGETGVGENIAGAAGGGSDIALAPEGSETDN